MKERCYKPKDSRYKWYGARGITVCDRWLESFENFRDDMLSTWKPGLTLDRIDNDGNYEPSNCRWTTKSEQSFNRRAYGEIKLTGVTVNKKTGKYRALRKINGKTKHLGIFDSPEEAYSAYLASLNE